MIFFLFVTVICNQSKALSIMIWIRYGMMLDILINLKIDDFYWVDVLNPINSQEPVLQMVAIPPSYFRIVWGRGGGIHENVYIPCLSYWIEIWISACTQIYMTIVTVHSRFWSPTNNTLGPMLIERECKCSGKYFCPPKIWIWERKSTSAQYIHSAITF